MNDLLVGELAHCHLYRNPNRCLTIFKADQAMSANWPPDDENFVRIGNECGFTDLVDYVVDHDLSHSFLAERMWDAPSAVLWAAAHEKFLDTTASLFEERWVYHWQRYANDLIGPLEPEWVDWLPLYRKLRA